jgi:hypothetical protein
MNTSKKLQGLDLRKMEQLYESLPAADLTPGSKATCFVHGAITIDSKVTDSFCPICGLYVVEQRRAEGIAPNAPLDHKLWFI